MIPFVNCQVLVRSPVSRWNQPHEVRKQSMLVSLTSICEALTLGIDFITCPDDKMCRNCHFEVLTLRY